MFASFQKYVYICTKNETPSRRYSTPIIGRYANLREKEKMYNNLIFLLI